jgi:hypothetical protein
MVPSTEDALQDELEIGKEICSRHIFDVETPFDGKNDFAVVVLEMVRWDAVEACAFVSKGQRSGTGDSGATVENATLVFRQLGSCSHQTHVSQQNVEELRKFVQFQPSQEQTDPGNLPAAVCRDR